MTIEQTKESRAVRQVWKQRAIVSHQPAPESALTNALQGLEQGQRHDLAGIQLALTVLAIDLHQLLGDATEQFRDKIVRGHEFVAFRYTLVGVGEFSTNL